MPDGMLHITLFEKTKPILKEDNGHKVSYEKGLRQFCRIWMARKQSQSKPIYLAPRFTLGIEM